MRKIGIIFTFLYFFIAHYSLIYAQNTYSLLFPIGGTDKIHIVKAGENIISIAERYNMAAEHIMWANGKKNLKASAGESLVIPGRRIIPKIKNAPPEYVVINIPEYMTYLFKNQAEILYFPIAAGHPSTPTPVAETNITNKIKDPVWLPPEWAEGDGSPVPPGPSNPLGDRWIGLNLPGYGIHSTTSPDSIGLSVSHGCLRMRPKNAETFFEEVEVGMSVSIIYEPVLLGQDPTSKIIYITFFPDPYKKAGNLYELALKKLAFYGLENIADKNTLKTSASEQKGIPIPIIGSETTIAINGEEVDITLPPISLNGIIYVTDSFFAQIGVDTELTEETAVFKKNDISCEIPIWADLSWNGEYLIPLREVLERLNFQVEYLEQIINIKY